MQPGASCLASFLIYKMGMDHTAYLMRAQLSDVYERLSTVLDADSSTSFFLIFY